MKNDDTYIFSVTHYIEVIVSISTFKNNNKTSFLEEKGKTTSTNSKI